MNPTFRIGFLDYADTTSALHLKNSRPTVEGAGHKGTVPNTLLFTAILLTGMFFLFLMLEGRTPLDWAAGVFLATHPPVPKPETIALLERLQRAATTPKR